MLSIQIISLIIFVIAILVIPVIDQLFFYSAFNFKGVLSQTLEKKLPEYKEDETTESSGKENNKNIYRGTNDEIGGSTDDATKKIIVIGEDREGQHEIKSDDSKGHATPLREEPINVVTHTHERPPAPDTDCKNYQESGVEIIERAEAPVVSKEVWVIEEVSIVKEVEERNETIKESVRKT